MKINLKNRIPITNAMRNRYLQFAFTRAALAVMISWALLISTLPTFTSAQTSGSQSNELLRPLVIAERDKLDSHFFAHQEFAIDLQATVQTVEANGQLQLKIGDAQYDITLEPNDLRSNSYRAVMLTEKGEVELPADPVSTYKGEINGEAGSDVRFSIRKDMFFGHIRTAKDWLFIDPLNRYIADAPSEQVVIYREADIRPESKGACGAIALDKHRKNIFGATASAPTPTAVTSSPRKVKVATDADFQFFQNNNSNASVCNSVIQGILNQVDGIYLQELNLTVGISFQLVRATNTILTSTNANTLLTQFKDDWNNNRPNVTRDVAHLFTGKNIDGTTVGIAFVGVVCNFPDFSYGLTQQINSMFKVTAHEIGHNFNANHDDQFNPPTATCNGAGPLMCSFVQAGGPNQFSQRSKDDIATHINNFGSCLEAGSGLWVGSSSGANFNTSQWAIWSADSNLKELAGDFNGDGKTDVMKFDVPASGTNCNLGLWVGLSDGTKFNASQWATWCTYKEMKVLAGDFNGDGKTDVMKFDVPSSGTSCTGGLWVGLSTGSGFNTSQWATWCTNKEIKVLAGDFNGDGKTDVMKFDVPASGTSCSSGLWVGLSTGSGFNTSQWATWCMNTDVKVLAGDFNGDGKTDVMKFDPSTNCGGGLWVGLSTGSSFNTSLWATWCTPVDIKVLAGDFNGDGKTDVMKFDPSTNCGGGLWVGLSTGSSFTTTQWATWCTPAPIKVLAGDFNGDGKTDVMKFDVPASGTNCNLGLWVGLSSGSSFNTSQWATWCTYTKMKVLAGDFTGDQKVDVMKFDIP